MELVRGSSDRLCRCSPSNSFTSNHNPLDSDGDLASGHSQVSGPPHMPWTTFFQMPTSYGNSCLTIRTLIPSGPSRYPPRVFARRSSVSCLSISQLSIVVTFVANDQPVRRNMIDKANSVIELSMNSRNSVIRSVMDGPRYYRLNFSKMFCKMRFILFISTSTHTRKIPLLPNIHSPQPKPVLQMPHRHHTIEQEPHEVRESPQRNAIPAPRTMMIHLRHASSTRETNPNQLSQSSPQKHLEKETERNPLDVPLTTPTMMRPPRLPRFTPRTPSPSPPLPLPPFLPPLPFLLLYLLYGMRRRPVSRHTPRIREAGARVADPDAQHQHIENQTIGGGERGGEVEEYL